MRGEEVLSFFAGSAILRNRQILRIKLKREVKLDGCRIWKDLGLGFVLVGASLSGLGATNLMRNSCYPAPLGRGETTIIKPLQTSDSHRYNHVHTYKYLYQAPDA